MEKEKQHFITELVDQCLTKFAQHSSTEALRNELHALLSSSLAKLNLVTTDEFEVVKKSLQRTQHMVDTLEKKVNAMQKESKQ